MDLVEASKDPEIVESDDPDSVCERKLYGPDIKVITTRGVPFGWILVDRKIPIVSLLIRGPRSSGEDEEEMGCC